MNPIKFSTLSRTLLADTLTPVGIYLKMRDQFANSIMLESSDYHAGKDSFSFVCLQPFAGIQIDAGLATTIIRDEMVAQVQVSQPGEVANALKQFVDSFQLTDNQSVVSANGLFGYTTYDAVQYFETIRLSAPEDESYKIPDMMYCAYRFIIAINHYKNELHIHENLPEGETSQIDLIQDLLANKNFATFQFTPLNNESSNHTDEEFIEIIKQGKRHCSLGDVIQIVLSRQFRQEYQGDEFNVYRALRSINPSPYLYYFDYGHFKIFGSSPESQIIVREGRAYISPIAGTYRRTGNDEADNQLAAKLSADPKENAEHVMLVDLARNDLSRNASGVTVEVYREVQYYSHVLHLVSKVSGVLSADTNVVEVMGNTFPAGTLSGAPKYRAMELIDKYEGQSRGYYGGCIGLIGFDGSINQAIMIRSFLCKANTLFYQAGAGVVNESQPESELNEVNNKLAALKAAIHLAKSL